MTTESLQLDVLKQHFKVYMPNKILVCTKFCAIIITKIVSLINNKIILTLLKQYTNTNEFNFLFIILEIVGLTTTSLMRISEKERKKKVTRVQKMPLTKSV